MKYKILVIDDEKMILNMLKITLSAKGYEVLCASSVEKALSLLKVHPNLILLDISMPGMNGLDFCMQIREYISCPILFLTARVTEQDKINGLLVGGDDYITKPFSMDELLVRIMAHLRREERRKSTAEVHFQGKLVIDYGSCIVFWEKEEICFSKKEFEIIQFLSKNAGMVFNRESIYEHIWGFDGEGDSIVVKEHVRNIRNKLSAYTNIQYIETVWGIGYKWVK